MKKIIAIFLIMSMTFSLIGCGEDQTNDKEDTSSNTSKEVVLKSYFEVFYNEGLSGAYKYFDQNYDDLSDELKAEYIEEIKKETMKRAEMYKVFESLEKVGQVPALLENVDYLYPNVFDSSKYEFNVYTLNENMKKAAQEISNDDIYILCKSYWNTEGNIEDMGFTPVIRKEIKDIIEKRFAKDDYDMQDIESYSSVITSNDKVYDDSNVKYPLVLVEDTSKFDLFDGMNKVTLYVAVKIVDNQVDMSEEDEIEEADPSDESTSKEEAPKNMVIRDYQGIGMDNLQVIDFDYKYSEESKEDREAVNRNLAIFGTVYDVEIGRIRLYTEGYEEPLKNYDEVSDTLINLLDCPFNNADMSDYMLYISFYDEDLNFHTIGFAGVSEEGQLPFCENTSIELESNDIDKVAFNSGEDAIVGVVEGSNEDFTSLSLVNNYEVYMPKDADTVYFALDSRVVNNYEEIKSNIIPMYISNNMYDIVVEYSNYGEVIETSSSFKNIKAGSWVIFDGILNGDGEAYTIKFKLKNGTEKEMIITTSEADDAVLLNGYVMKIK